MHYSEEEAKTKTCWASMGCSSGWRYCKANECTGWQWYSLTDKTGYCGKGD